VSTDPADPAITVSWPWRRGPELPLWTSGTTGFAPSSPSEGVISPRSSTMWPRPSRTGATRWILERACVTLDQGARAGCQVPPGLDDPAKIPMVVEHFAAHCAVCHGAPGVPKGGTLPPENRPGRPLTSTRPSLGSSRGRSWRLLTARKQRSGSHSFPM